MLNKQEQQDYADLIAMQNARDDARKLTKPHRLPTVQYTMSDCEVMLTLCARHSGKPFTNPSFARAICECLLHYCELRNLIIYCYCLMPDHLHLIARLFDVARPERNKGVLGIHLESMLDIFGDFKSYTTSQIWWKLGNQGRLWQRSSYDTVIRYNESSEAAVHYVLNNPKRKGMVEEWQDYPFAAVIDPWY